LSDLFVCLGRVAGQGEFLCRNAFGDRELKRVPLPIGTLAVRGNGIMDLRLYALLRQTALQLLAVGRKYRKDVPNMGLSCHGEEKVGVLDFRPIARRDVAAALVAAV
jgi:hypothetical protein